MNPSQHVTTLRQTHRTATTLLPVLTATLTVAGAVIAAMEARAPRVSDDPQGQVPNESGELAPTARPAAYRAGRVTLRGYIATLAGRLLMVALGIALVFALVYLASATGRVGQAILLTTLILLTLYLTEKVTRRR